MENLHNTITLGFNENIHAMSSEETTNNNNSNNNNNNNYNNNSSNNFNNDVAKSNSELTLTLKSLDTTLKRHTEALLLSDKRFCTLVNNLSSSSSSNKNIEFDSTQQQPDSLLRFLGNGTVQQIGGSSSARSNVAYQRHNSMQQHSNRDVDKMERKVNTRQQAKNGHQLLSRSFTNTSASNVLFMNGDLEDIKEDIVRNKKTTIQARIVFLKLGEIDTLHDRFNANVFIQAKWREPALDHTYYKEFDKIDWSKYWSPKLFVENVFGDPRENIEYSISYDSKGKATVYEKRRVLSHFQEFMELNKFPFDTQDLTVTLTSERNEAEVELIEDVSERCALNPQSFVDEQEWKLHKIVVTWRRTRTDDNKSPKTNHSAFSAACKASRRPEFFIWNILVVMFLICSLSFATFAVDLNLPQNRLQLSFILLLTTVSFKFVVNQSLPMIAYLTYLDKYILGSMAILCCICVWHAVVPLFNNSPSCCSEHSKYADTVALIILSIIYIVFHAFFIFIIACVTSKTRNYDRGNEIFPEFLCGNDSTTEPVVTPSQTANVDHFTNNTKNNNTVITNNNSNNNKVLGNDL